MKLDPRHLKCVTAIIKHGTFNKAADALGVSQPALSKSISLLERSLGAKVFERGHRGATLTEAGRIVARSAHNVDLLLKNVQAEIRANAERVQGPLTVGATPSLMLGLVPEALLRLAKSHPRLTVTVIEGLDSFLAPALERGDIDLLISPVASSLNRHANLVEINLATESFFIGLAKEHRLTAAKELRIRDLAGEAFVLPTAGSAFHRVVEALFIAAGIPWPENTITTNCLFIQERLIVETGRVFIGNHAQLLGRTVPYQVIPLVDAPPRSICIRRMKGITLSSLADHFVQHLQDIAQAVAADLS